jgi:CBS-domain-containing membrane protein
MKSASLATLQRLWVSLWPSDVNHASHNERWISAVGGFIGVLAVLWVSSRVLDHQGAAMIIASMGASAVLLFAVPHGALSQPWAVVGGNVISALIGVTCAQMIGDAYLGAAVAVGLSIAAMYYLRCLHPPGGATALVAVLGGDAVQQLGYGFVVSPVLINTLIILTTAVLVNMPFRWRRYPAAFAKRTVTTPKEPTTEKALLAHQDLVYAISKLDSFIDVSEEDLIRIFSLAVHHTHNPVPCHLNGEACRREDPTCFCRQLLETGREAA